MTSPNGIATTLKDRKMIKSRQARWTRLIIGAAVLWIFWAGAAAWGQEPAQGVAEVAAEPADLWTFTKEIFSNLFNSRALMDTLAQPKYFILAIVALNVIVFTETGLLVGFCLPGDSLLVVAGLVAQRSGWDMPLLLGTLCAAAIIGDSVGYAIGLKTGPKIFKRENSFFFHKDHLLKAQHFYEKHGGKTIILARFMPIIRTFAPVVAGVGRMNYPRFLMFNIVGGIGWVCSMVLIGYYLHNVINPALRPIFGGEFDVQDHVEKVVILVVLLSISPGIYFWARNKLAKKAAPAQEELVQAGK
jgi:membrane-associated protein